MNRVSLSVFVVALLLSKLSMGEAISADTFVQGVAALPAEKQIARVMTKLKHINPGLTSTETHRIENGQVTEFTLSPSSELKDISPIRALAHLKILVVGHGHTSDISSLKGLKLEKLTLWLNPVSDLSPLAGMPIEWLNCASTKVRDLSPLKGMQIKELYCDKTEVTDFSPLEGMPLRILRCDANTAKQNARVLQSISSLQTINGQPADEFWKGANVSVTSTATAAPVPPRVAEKADMTAQKDAKQFARNQSSIKGLYVVRTDAGLRVGGAQDIIATAERVSSDRETICDFVSDVAKDTQISMEEAERLLKVRHPVWQAGCKIRFSYSNKYTKQAGGSAGGAFSVLLLSLLDGMQIDPGFAMTGDVTVDGKIREVGAVAEKLRGALLDKCRVVAIPEANEENLNDLVVLYSPAMLWSMQILSITTLDDAVAVARTDRAPNLAKAMELFGQVQRSLPTGATVYALRNPAVVQTLRQVLQLAPNHSSAEYMLRVANNQLPVTLSLGGSLDEIWAAPGPLLGFLFSDYKEPEKSKRYYFEKVPSGAFKAAMDRLNWLQFRLHPKTRELKTAMVDYMISLDQLHRQSAFSSGTLRLHLAKRDKVLSEAHLLGTDRKTLEEMMH
ncbi:MAG: hypothetical protein HZA88_11230 [Verrucomicrobia bacterium]|nr:hypothetical protein [Verrucomicrobiota bacterium]